MTHKFVLRLLLFAVLTTTSAFATLSEESSKSVNFNAPKAGDEFVDVFRVFGDDARAQQ